MAMREAARRKRGNALDGNSGDFLDIIGEMSARDAEAGTDVGRGMTAPVQPDRGTPAMLASMTTAGNQEGGGLMGRAKAQVMPVSGRFNLFGGMRGSPSGGQQKKGSGCYRGPNGEMICPTQQGESQVGTPDDGNAVGGGMPIMKPQGGSSMPMMRPNAQGAPASSPNKTASPSPATPMGSIVARAQATGDEDLILLADNFQNSMRLLSSLPPDSPTYKVAASAIYAIEAGKNLNSAFDGLGEKAHETALKEQRVQSNKQMLESNKDRIEADRYRDEPQRVARINAAINGQTDENSGINYGFKTKNQRIDEIVRENMMLRKEYLAQNQELVQAEIRTQTQSATSAVMGHDLARDILYSFDDNPDMPLIQGDTRDPDVLRERMIQATKDREDMDKAVFNAYADVTTIEEDGSESKPLRGEELQGYMRVHFADNLRLQFAQQIGLAYRDKNGDLPPGMTDSYIEKISMDAANMFSDAYADMISTQNGRVEPVSMPAPQETRETPDQSPYYQ